MTLAYSQSLVRLANEQITNSPLIRPVICFDGGNRSIQWRDPSGQLSQLPSFIKSIADWEDVEPDANSVVMEKSALLNSGMN